MSDPFLRDALIAAATAPWAGPMAVSIIAIFVCMTDLKKVGQEIPDLTLDRAEKS
jgi:hypothetical protein